MKNLHRKRTGWNNSCISGMATGKPRLTGADLGNYGWGSSLCKQGQSP